MSISYLNWTSNPYANLDLAPRCSCAQRDLYSLTPEWKKAFSDQRQEKTGESLQKRWVLSGRQAQRWLQNESATAWPAPVAWEKTTEKLEDLIVDLIGLSWSRRETVSINAQIRNNPRGIFKDLSLETQWQTDTNRSLFSGPVYTFGSVAFPGTTGLAHTVEDSELLSWEPAHGDSPQQLLFSYRVDTQEQQDFVRRVIGCVNHVFTAFFTEYGTDSLDEEANKENRPVLDISLSQAL